MNNYYMLKDANQLSMKNL